MEAMGTAFSTITQASAAGGHYMEQFINRTLCQVTWIIISKTYNLHPFMLIYITPIYQHIYNIFSML